MIAAFISNVFLWPRGRFYQAALIIQAAGYLAGLLSYVSHRLTQWAPFKLAHFFVLGNAATLVAWWKFWHGDKLVTWEPSQRS